MLKPTWAKLLAAQEIVLSGAIIVAPENAFSEKFNAVELFWLVSLRDLHPKFKLPLTAIRPLPSSLLF